MTREQRMRHAKPDLPRRPRSRVDDADWNREREHRQRPEPFTELFVSLDNKKNGANLRLQRDTSAKKMVMLFSEPLDDALRDRLKKDGWEPSDLGQAWGKYIGLNPQGGAVEAMRYFESLATELRARNDLPPIEFPSVAR